jgi:hypothetical protein
MLVAVDGDRAFQRAHEVLLRARDAGQVFALAQLPREPERPSAPASPRHRPRPPKHPRAGAGAERDEGGS